MERTNYSRNKLVSTLLNTPHAGKGGAEKLKGYIEPGLLAIEAEPELFGRFLVWNGQRGKVRDAKVAFPAIGLRGLTKTDRDLAENAVACALRYLSPRDIVRFYDFSKLLTVEGRIIAGGWRRLLEEGINLYLQRREESPAWWDRTALQHRRALKRLYRIAHRKAPEREQRILFGVQDPAIHPPDERGRIKPGPVIYPAGSAFEAVARLRTMSPREAAGTILNFRIPFEVIVGSVAKVKDESIALAMIEGATGNQVINNSKMFIKLGVNDKPVLKAAYEAAIERAKRSRNVETLKAGVAADAIEDEEIAEKLINLQRVRTKKLGSIEGDWLVLADASGSMHEALEVGRKIAALLTERVKGAVHLVFFDTNVTPFDVTGLSYDQIVEKTRRIQAGGATAIGCGLDYLRASKVVVDGIAIVSDGGDNTEPKFMNSYLKYIHALEVEPTVYFYQLKGQEPDYLTGLCAERGIKVNVYDLMNGVDYYALPMLVETMNTNPFSTLQEIMDTPLLKLEDAFRKEAA